MLLLHANRDEADIESAYTAGVNRQKPLSPVQDVTALLIAADPDAPLAQQHLWLYAVMQWLRKPPDSAAAAAASGQSALDLPVERLRMLLDMLDRYPERYRAVSQLLRACYQQWDLMTLLADFGFSPSSHFLSELGARLRLHFLPVNPASDNLADLFNLLFESTEDIEWLAALDASLLSRLSHLFLLATEPQEGQPLGWRAAFYDSINVLSSQIRAVGLTGEFRSRMPPEWVAERPFTQLVSAAEQLRQLAEKLTFLTTRQQSSDGIMDTLNAIEMESPALTKTQQRFDQQIEYMQALLVTCVQASESIYTHLEQHGVSVNIVFQIEQVRERAKRIEMLLRCVSTPQAAPEIQAILYALIKRMQERSSIRQLFSQHYSLLARKVAERSALSGEHYITRNRAEYWQMIRSAAGGGALLALTTYIKFAITSWALSLFWSGLAAGVNYAISFLIIYVLHWTVATKQPAMTAPALAAKLKNIHNAVALDEFVDEVVHLIRSQIAGILGNILVVAPVALSLALLAGWLNGQSLITATTADKTLQSLSLLGPTPVYAILTGVLLFASSILAGWVENWFVFYKLDYAICWNPWLTRHIGAQRARRWARWWRHHISGVASNLFLGLMLGLVPVISRFFGLPIEVRHVTLSSGQIAAAAGALGPDIVYSPLLWWSLLAIPLTGFFNVAVSFIFAFAVALRSRQIRFDERRLVLRAIWQRFKRQPLSFFYPPRPTSSSSIST